MRDRAKPSRPKRATPVNLASDLGGGLRGGFQEEGRADQFAACSNDTVNTDCRCCWQLSGWRSVESRNPIPSDDGKRSHRGGGLRPISGGPEGLVCAVCGVSARGQRASVFGPLVRAG